MNKLWAPLILLVGALLALSCGGSGRQLQSLSIQQTANGQQIQFVATGAFSGPSATVTPLAVMWSFGAHVRVFFLQFHSGTCSR